MINSSEQQEESFLAIAYSSANRVSVHSISRVSAEVLSDIIIANFFVEGNTKLS